MGRRGKESGHGSRVTGHGCGGVAVTLFVHDLLCEMYTQEGRRLSVFVEGLENILIIIIQCINSGPPCNCIITMFVFLFARRHQINFALAKPTMKLNRTFHNFDFVCVCWLGKLLRPHCVSLLSVRLYIVPFY